MEQVYAWLSAIGYPRRGIDHLRRHRLAVILILAVVCWIIVIIAGWLLTRWLWGG